MPLLRSGLQNGSRSPPPCMAAHGTGNRKCAGRLHHFGGSLLGRCVGRSSNNANANGGLVYAYTSNGSSNSNTNNGVRLAIRPKGVVIEAIDA